MLKKTITSSFLFLLIALPVSAQATGLSDLQTNLSSFGGNIGYNSSDADLASKIAQIVNIALGFVGIIAVVIIIYAGFKWMTAAGNEETVKDARNNIKNAVIGIVIIFAAFVIVNFTVSQVSDATGAGGGTTGGGGSVAGNGACVFTDDDNTQGDSGNCCSTAECINNVTRQGCMNSRGREYRALDIDTWCGQITWSPSQTCSDLSTDTGASGDGCPQP